MDHREYKEPFDVAGIFGPKMSGKTTLAIELSRVMWERQRTKSLVLDPIGKTVWGEHCWVTADEVHFRQIVHKARGYLVIVDEASQTIKRDEELIPLFTSITHKGHQLLVIGHNGSNLLPIMREQIDRIYLFRQPKPAAEKWAETMTHDGLLEATTLKQYEFIDFRMYGDNHQISKLKL